MGYFQVDAAIRMLIKDLIDFKGKTEDDLFGLFPEYFMKKGELKEKNQGNRNFFIEPIGGRKIEIDTVHGVKGETHDAALYLKTEEEGKKVFQTWKVIDCREKD